ncbi:type III secretion system chaperone [Rugamonas aquatica]|nr:type III secretion system chaperone [Rugamonas aquatica]
MTPQNLVQELGQRLGITLTLDQAGLARLMIDNTLPVDFEHDESGDRLLVYSTLGITPLGEERETVFADLLSANLFGAELGPCSPALDMVRDELLLWFALDEQSDIDGAMKALENLVAQTEHWRSRIASGGDDLASSGAPTPNGNLDNFILA